MKKLLNNGPLLIIFAATLWAFDGIIRRSLYVLPPIVIVFFEHLVGALILLPFFLKDLLIKKARLGGREFLAITFVSLLSGLLGTLWFTTALLQTQFISFSVVYLLQKLQPLFAVAAGRILLKEKITKKYLVYAGLAMVSAYFVTFPSGRVNFATGSGTLIAALFAVGAAFAWGTSTAFSKFTLIKNNDRFITGIRFILTTIMAGAAVFIMGSQSTLITINLSQLSRFALIAVSTGMVAILIYYRGLKKTEVKVSTILELVYPLLAVVIDMVVYKSFLTPTQIVAAAALLFYMFKIAQLNVKK
jgi:drug/metabolite transporter (DMT)-like permease